MVFQPPHTPQTTAILPEPTASQRTFRRVRVRWPTTLVASNHEIMDGMARNLSFSGVFLYYSHTDPWALPLRADERVEVVFNIPDHDQIQARARVAWSDILAVEETSTLMGIGLEFVDVSPEDHKYLLWVCIRKACAEDMTSND